MDGQRSTSEGPSTPIVRTPEMDQWETLRDKIATRQPSSSDSVFGVEVADGRVYRWGLATATDRAIPREWKCLSKLACDATVSRKWRRDWDVPHEAERAIEVFDGAHFQVSDCAHAVLWAAALPHLIDDLGPDRWWRMLAALQEFRNAASRRNSSSPEYLIACGELGMTLAWRLSVLPSCRRLQKSSLQSVARWFDHEEDSISQSVAGIRNARLVLATLWRYKHLVESTSRSRFKRQQKRVAADLATWVISQTRRDGTAVFSSVAAKEIKDDLGKSGLLALASEFDSDALSPALGAALGKDHKPGRLEWEVSLPETMFHDEDAQAACLLPDWDVARSRTYVDYSGDDVRVEVHAGKSIVFSGPIETLIESDGETLHPRGNWVSTCEYSDDDVHFLELEQPWSGGLIVQRQFLVVRDDRCLLLADTVLPANEAAAPESRNLTPTQADTASATLEHIVRFPTSDSIDATNETETREIFLSDRRSRVMAIPIAANEWRMAASHASLRVSEDRQLMLASRGRQRIYAPLWLDFQRVRFRRKRTWRQLTVADQLRICRRDEAVGYRIQVGSEQWFLYRSLLPARPRTVLGKHFIADFYCARFDSGDGSMEDLVTVDNQAEG